MPTFFQNNKPEALPTLVLAQLIDASLPLQNTRASYFVIKNMSDHLCAR